MESVTGLFNTSFDLWRNGIRIVKDFGARHFGVLVQLSVLPWQLKAYFVGGLNCHLTITLDFHPTIAHACIHEWLHQLP
jgi:hypothetical protein